MPCPRPTSGRPSAATRPRCRSGRSSSRRLMSAPSLVNEELQPSPTPAPPRPVTGLAGVALVLAAAVTAVMVKAALMLRDYNDHGTVATVVGVVLVVLSLYAWVPCARAFVSARERATLLDKGGLVAARRGAAPRRAGGRLY